MSVLRYTETESYDKYIKISWFTEKDEVVVAIAGRGDSKQVYDTNTIRLTPKEFRKLVEIVS